MLFLTQQTATARAPQSGSPRVGTEPAKGPGYRSVPWRQDQGDLAGRRVIPHPANRKMRQNETKYDTFPDPLLIWRAGLGGGQGYRSVKLIP